jgi:purine-binding chemotaxis protein CheW
MTGRDPAPSSSTVELCAFRVGDEEYVIDLRRIREIVQPLPVTAVPRAPEFVEGVIDLRGEVVPLVDVRRRLGLPPRSPGARPKMLIVNIAGRSLALLVDSVSEVVRIPRSAIGPPPALLAAGGQRLFLGVCAGRPERPAGSSPPRGSGPAAPPAAGRLRLLLDVKALLQPAPPPGLGGEGSP